MTLTVGGRCIRPRVQSHKWPVSWTFQPYGFRMYRSRYWGAAVLQIQSLFFFCKFISFRMTSTLSLTFYFLHNVITRWPKLCRKPANTLFQNGIRRSTTPNTMNMIMFPYHLLHRQHKLIKTVNDIKRRDNSYRKHTIHKNKFDQIENLCFKEKKTQNYGQILFVLESIKCHRSRKTIILFRFLVNNVEAMILKQESIQKRTRRDLWKRWTRTQRGSGHSWYKKIVK